MTGRAMMSAMRGLVLLNGRVFTARAGEPPFTGGVAIAGDRIVAVGGDHAARAAAPPDSTVIDVGGRSILPGFVDAHHHLAFTGAELAAIDVRYPGVASIADLVARVADAAERTPDGQWIRAVGMNPEMFPDGRLPTRWDLDEATRVHPVLVQHMSGHHALANSLGLETRGLTEVARDPEGGHLVRDDRGRLTGYCLDAAQQLVVPPAVDIGHHGPGFHDDAPLEEIVGDIERGSRACTRRGHHVDRRCTGHASRADRLPSRPRARAAGRPHDGHADLVAAGRVRGARAGRAVRRRPAGHRTDEVLRRRGADGWDRRVHDPVRPERRVQGVPVLDLRGCVPGGHLDGACRRLADRRPRPGRPCDRPGARRVRGGAARPAPR